MALDCYNCDTLGAHESFGSICNTPRSGGISALVMIDCGQEVADPEDGTEVNSLIDADGAYLFDTVSMSLEGSEQVLSQYSASPCDLPRVQYVNWTGTLRDLAFTKQNFNDVYSKLVNGHRISGMIARLCPNESWDDLSLYMNGNVSFAGAPIIPLEPTDTDRFELTYTFRGTIEMIDTPAGVFE